MFKGKEKYWRWAFISLVLISVIFILGNFLSTFIMMFLPEAYLFLGAIFFMIFSIISILVAQILVARYFIKVRLNFDEVWMLNARTGSLFSIGFLIIKIVSGSYLYSSEVFATVIKALFYTLIQAGICTVILALFSLITNSILKNKFKNFNKINIETLDQLEE